MAEHKASRPKVSFPKLNASKKTYNFTFSLSGMISLIGGCGVTLAAFFVMGILIGRGYRPEADVPQLEVIMPSKQHGEVAPPPQILKPEELDYPERLKEKPETSLTDETAAEVPPAAESAPEATATAKDDGPIKPEVFKPTKSKPGEQVYNYVYQVASFKELSMAEALTNKLVAAGLTATIEAGDVKGSIWNRVQVLYHGTPTSTSDMKAVLAKFGIKKPLLKKKDAVE